MKALKANIRQRGHVLLSNSLTSSSIYILSWLASVLIKKKEKKPSWFEMQLSFLCVKVLVTELPFFGVDENIIFTP